MLKKIFLLLGLALFVLIAVILFKTFTVKSLQPQVAIATAITPADSAVSHLQQAIRYKTISVSDKLPADTAAFQAFHAFLQKAYPLVFSTLHLQKVNNLGLLFTWTGKNSTLKPAVLMAHQDVVPVEGGTENIWSVPPFDGVVKDGYIYGRGTVDDKGSMIALLEATEMLLQRGVQPQQTLYLVFGHDEELGGRQGAKAIAEVLKSKGIHLQFVLDEGGAITQKKVPGMGDKPVAVVGTAEKGYISLELSVNITGGHSAMPAKETAIDVLAAAITRVHQSPFEPSLSKASEDFFRFLAPEMPFTDKMAFSNLWLFKPLIFKQLGNSNEGNAMMRTTISVTKFNSGVKDNVIPTNATTVINFRILPGMTSKDVTAHVIKVINDKRVQHKISGFAVEPTPVTSPNHSSFQLLTTAIRQTFPNTIVAPYLDFGATDSRNFLHISEATLQFIPFTNIEGYHGIDERVSIKQYHDAINFYYHFILKL